MICLLRFASLPSFSDPHQLVKDKNNNPIPYGLLRYNQIVEQCYAISKNINTSYLDLMEITPKEVDMMLNLLEEEAKRNDEIMKKAKAKSKK